MNHYDTTAFLLFLPFYLAALGLYHLMVFAVNRRLAASERIPHSLFWAGWSRVKDAYRRFYPRSIVYPLTLACAVATAAIAVGFVALRIYEHTHGRLP